MKISHSTFLEFFAGGGMARAGLGERWQCLFANDFDAMKAATYAANWGDEHFVCDDVANIRPSQLPGSADLAWASFPCQDLSLAGDYLGLGDASSPVKTRSGTFWPFWALMRALKAEKRAPRIIVLENVYGLLTSRSGKDFLAVCSAFAGSQYRFGAIVLDAARFIPQSRQRVFFVAIDASVELPGNLVGKMPIADLHPNALIDVHDKLSIHAKQHWLWWALPLPGSRTTTLTDLIEETPTGVVWNSDTETAKLLEMMSPIHSEKVLEAQRSGKREVGCLYKRTRTDSHGRKAQRAEVRFDGVAGCLRTPGGGSSRQTILVVEGSSVRSRLLSPREAARLMGLPDSYKLPLRYNDAYHVAGDGVCVEVVRHLAVSLLDPIIEAQLQAESLSALA
jgi:DNA (cytosine-5)-methyltransferase 1